MLYADQMPPAMLPLPFTLALLSVAAGLVTMSIFRLVSRPDAIRRARRQVQAQLLALRLFGDEPALLWHAWVALLGANVRYLAVMLPPIAAAALPVVLAWPYLEALYGRAALPVGAATTLTVRLRAPLHDPLPPASLVAPAGLRVATPAVRVADAGEIAWQIEAAGPVSGPVRIRVGSDEVARDIQVGNGLGYLMETTRGGSPEIQSVRVPYRRTRLELGGIAMPWDVWFVLISMSAALGSMPRLGVVL